VNIRPRGGREETEETRRKPRGDEEEAEKRLRGD